MPAGGRGGLGANNLNITAEPQQNNNDPIPDDEDEDVIAPVHGVDNGHRKGCQIGRFRVIRM